MARTATLQKVAEAAGVSISTVSRILRTPDFATKETRKSVIGAAARMGYPGLSHELIAEGRGGCVLNNIVLLAPKSGVYGPRGLNSSDWIYRDVIPTLQRIAAEKGFQVILSTYDRDKPWNSADMAMGPVCGVLWMSRESDEMLSRIPQSIPVVVINGDPFWPPRTCVMVHNRAVVFAGASHLRSLGHRHIAYFDVDEAPAPLNLHSRQRLTAYQEAIEHFELGSDPDLLIRERFGFDEHPQAVARAMDRMGKLKSRPTALITPLGYAIQFLKESRKRGIRVPEDLSIVAIDEAHAAELADPALTTIDCSFGRCAEIAIELLLEQKKSPQTHTRTVLIEPRLIVRNSTAPAANAKE